MSACVARAWAIFCVMAAANLLSSLQQVGLATVSGEVAASFKADAATLALLSAAFSYIYSLMQIPAGVLVDMAGARKSVSISLCCAALGTLLFAMADSVAAAVAGRVLTGVGLCMVAVPLMKLTAVWFPPREFGRMTAISFTVGSAGYWAATTPVAWLCGLWGWRLPFAGMAALLGILAALVWIVVRDAPEGAPARAGESFSCRAVGRMLLHIVRNRQLWLLGFWYLLQGGVYFSFVGLWGGQYLMQALHASAEDAGWVLAPAAGALVTAPLFTWIVARMGRRRPLFMALPLASLLLTLPFFAGWTESLSLPALCACFFALATASIGGAAVVFDAAKILFPTALAGTVCGFVNMFPLIGGAVMQQIIGGVIAMRLESGASAAAAFAATFTIYMGCAIVSLILGCNYRECKEPEV